MGSTQALGVCHFQFSLQIHIHQPRQQELPQVLLSVLLVRTQHLQSSLLSTATGCTVPTISKKAIDNLSRAIRAAI